MIVYQIRQPFKPSEVTPEDENRFGAELVFQLTKRTDYPRTVKTRDVLFETSDIIPFPPRPPSAQAA